MALGAGVLTPQILTDTTGSTIDDWQVNEHTVTTIGTVGAFTKVQSLLLDINALVGNITVRLYHNINGVQRQSYTQVFSVAVDGPGLWIVNGSIIIYGLLLVTAQSNNALDNGQAIGWEHVVGSG
jgi:hypothetical protein